jgi:hypothetical protein
VEGWSIERCVGVCECVCGRGEWERKVEEGWEGLVGWVYSLFCLVWDVLMGWMHAWMGVGKYWCRVYGCMAVRWLAREPESIDFISRRCSRLDGMGWEGMARRGHQDGRWEQKINSFMSQNYIHPRLRK